MNKYSSLCLSPLLSLAIFFGVVIFFDSAQEMAPSGNTLNSSDTISSVNGDSIDVSTFQEHYQAERWFFAYQIRRAVELSEGDQNVLSLYLQEMEVPLPYNSLQNGALLFLQDENAFGRFIIQQLERQTALEQEAERLGIKLDENATQAQIDEFMLHWVSVNTGDKSFSNEEMEAKQAEFATEFYQSAQDMVNLDSTAINQIFYLRALRHALLTEITKDIPTETVWVESRHILLSPENLQYTSYFDPAICETDAWQIAKEEADEVYTDLQAGADFAELAKSVSDDPGSASAGGLLPWTEAEYAFVEPYADAILSAEIGEITEPVCTQFGWHIIEVLGRESRAVNEADLKQRQLEAYQEWENELLITIDVERYENWIDLIPTEPTYEDLVGNLGS